MTQISPPEGATIEQEPTSQIPATRLIGKAIIELLEKEPNTKSVTIQYSALITTINATEPPDPPLIGQAISELTQLYSLSNGELELPAHELILRLIGKILADAERQEKAQQAIAPEFLSQRAIDYLTEQYQEAVSETVSEETIKGIVTSLTEESQKLARRAEQLKREISEIERKAATIRVTTALKGASESHNQTVEQLRRALQQAQEAEDKELEQQISAILQGLIVITFPEVPTTNEAELSEPTKELLNLNKQEQHKENELIEVQQQIHRINDMISSLNQLSSAKIARLLVLYKNAKDMEAPAISETEQQALALIANTIEKGQESVQTEKDTEPNTRDPILNLAAQVSEQFKNQLNKQFVEKGLLPAQLIDLLLTNEQVEREISKIEQKATVYLNQTPPPINQSLGNHPEGESESSTQQSTTLGDEAPAKNEEESPVVAGETDDSHEEEATQEAQPTQSTAIEILQKWLEANEGNIAENEKILQSGLEKAAQFWNQLMNANQDTLKNIIIEFKDTQGNSRYKIDVDKIIQLTNIKDLAQKGVLSTGRLTILVTLLEFSLLKAIYVDNNSTGEDSNIFTTIKTTITSLFSKNDTNWPPSNIQVPILPLQVVVPPLQKALEKLIDDTIQAIKGKYADTTIQKQEATLPKLESKVTTVKLEEFRQKFIQEIQTSPPLKWWDNLPDDYSKVLNDLDQQLRDRTPQLANAPENEDATNSSIALPSAEELEQIITEVTSNSDNPLLMRDLEGFVDIYKQIVEFLQSQTSLTSERTTLSDTQGPYSAQEVETILKGITELKTNIIIALLASDIPSVKITPKGTQDTWGYTKALVNEGEINRINTQTQSLISPLTTIAARQRLTILPNGETYRQVNEKTLNQILLALQNRLQVSDLSPLSIKQYESYLKLINAILFTMTLITARSKIIARLRETGIAIDGIVTIRDTGEKALVLEPIVKSPTDKRNYLGYPIIVSTQKLSEMLDADNTIALIGPHGAGKSAFLEVLASISLAMSQEPTNNETQPYIVRNEDFESLKGANNKTIIQMLGWRKGPIIIDEAFDEAYKDLTTKLLQLKADGGIQAPIIIVANTYPQNAELQDLLGALSSKSHLKVAGINRGEIPDQVDKDLGAIGIIVRKPDKMTPLSQFDLDYLLNLLKIKPAQAR